MNTLQKYKQQSLARRRTAWDNAMRLKDAGLADQFAADSMMLANFGEQRRHRHRYGAFRGWLYSAINALATEGAGQPVSIIRTRANAQSARDALFRVKGNFDLLPKHQQAGIEIVEDHPLVSLFEHPNRLQHRFQFVYSFISNLLLTGWAFLVAGEGENGLEIYSLPTTWIAPDHKEGPFSKFKLRNPNKPSAEGEMLDRSQVAFAHLPNPADPLNAVAPASAQMMAIRIDDHIQTSQEKFFDNGIFPSVVVTLGKNPHPEVPGGIRPRLSPAQRRQVNSVIRRTMGGIQNYGNPGIVDGMIEKIERLSADHNEMGWEKSEDKVRRRILSAFGLHDFILGESLPGSYAQAYIVDDRTCRKINSYLSLLSTVTSNFVGQGEVSVFWEPCTPTDPENERKWWESGLKNNVVTRNEYRAKLGLPADEDEPDRGALLSTVGGMEKTASIIAKVGEGKISKEAAIAILVEFLEIEESRAASMVGNLAVSDQQLLQESIRQMSTVAGLLEQK